MKKAGPYLKSLPKESKFATSVREDAFFSEARPKGYFADALTAEDIKLENLIAAATAKKNASHKVSE